MNLLVEMSAAEARSVFRSLGVDANTLSPAELKQKYRQLMMQNHPDRGGDEEVAKKLSVAFDVLKDAPSSSSPGSASQTRSASNPNPTFHNIDYVKQWFREKSAGQESQEWTVTNFDGVYFRGMFTVRGNSSMFPDMARIMKIWDRFYKCRAVLVGTRQMLENGTIAVIWCDGSEVKPIATLEFDSFNLNPSNDQSFVRNLPQVLDKLSGK